MEKNDIEEMKSIIIATPNTAFANGIKKNIDSLDRGFKVLDVIVTDEDLIEALEKQDKKIGFKGLIIASDIAKKNNNFRLEYLSDFLVTIHQRYPDLSIALLSKEKAGHPFLYEVVQMGIYNIFLQNKQVTIPEILDVLEKPLNFSDVGHLREINELIPWRKLSSSPQAIEIIINNEEDLKEANPKNTETKSILPNIKIPKLSLPKQQKQGLDEMELLEEELLDISIHKEIILQERVVGTVVVAVTSVVAHLGATHTAISIASFLKKKGHAVCIVEGNYSEDFDRIHSLYEGETQQLWREDIFDIKGIDHYKFRDSMNIGEIITGYEFVILDIGELHEDTPFYNEFYRAHIKCVLCSSLEWKYHWIEEFNRNIPLQDDLIYVVPFATKEALQDIEKIVGESRVISMPINTEPYDTNSETDRVILSIMEGFLKKPDKRVVTKSTVVIACVVSVLLTTAIIGTFVFL